MLDAPSLHDADPSRRLAPPRAPYVVDVVPPGPFVSGWHEGTYGDYYRDPPIHTRWTGEPPPMGERNEADLDMPY